ncbi:MAG: M20/M25/M40 family metallo-hydrolase [Kiritimatiellia bacterium]|jgi:glutamate carboxypeptidase
MKTLQTRPHIAEIIQTNQKAILSLLEEMVNINSFSHNPAGINQVGELVREAMPPGFKHSCVTNDAGVNHHIFTKSGDGRDRPAIVLAGHLDTLCPPDPAFDRLREEGDILRGPGVNDMKGGDVVLIWALKTLHLCGALEQMPITCIFNGDEELGSPTSYKLFTDMRGAGPALVFECGGPADTVVTTRKGVARYRMRLTGKPNHFGNLQEPKISAIEELAHKILAVEAMNRTDNSIVTNVGRIDGGLAANAVAAAASMDFEVRYWDPALEQKIIRDIEQLAKNHRVPILGATLERLSYRPPMRPDADAMRLFDLIVERGRALGMRITEEKRGGVSDACWLAHAGVTVIDGLGPLGDHDFTPNEYIRKDTLFSRTELAANLLLDLQETHAKPGI